ncbi:hypothetical protein [Porticoccus hydrocarbonoclasticus]|uniref:hypothetical protein n=1 Tax=Porticoccus hydrocarbonoclasticus TaxID=1073414 RepID=UPI000562C6AB|nr:hypothetical protein [Porticoccus hydrocarbonoclasticus]
MKNTHKVVLAAALAWSSVPAMAEQCIEGGTVDSPTLTCTAADSGNIDDDRNNLSVTVESDAQIVRTEGRPVQLGGSDQSVDNQGLIESGDDDAIRGTGANLTVDNSGTIRGGDRGIRLQDDADNFTLINRESGEILARNQAVRLDNGDELENANITNYGLIESTEGRAIQSRGPGGTVINHGTLRGGEEVVEAREDFTIENRGTIALRGLEWNATTRSWSIDGSIATDDEDGVQFASGTLDNHGVILGTDDGIDIDEGRVHNHATGVIVSTGSASDSMDGGSGIDVDTLFEPTQGDVRPAGPLTIINEGYIEGVRAIGTDEASTSEITIENSGTLRGRSGTAIQLAPEQGDSSLLVSGDSNIFGDVIFGAGDDLLTVEGLTSGLLINGIFDGGAGNNSVFLNDYLLSDLLSFEITDDLINLSLAILNNQVLSGQFINFATWTFSSDGPFSTEDLASRFATPVPTPAILPLFLLGLAGIWASRARLLK